MNNKHKRKIYLDNATRKQLIEILKDHIRWNHRSAVIVFQNDELLSPSLERFARVFGIKEDLYMEQVRE